MSYEPTNWKAGDTVTSEKLNKIEQGISAANSSGSGVFKVNITLNEAETAAVMDKTWNEIFSSEGIGYAYLAVEAKSRMLCLISEVYENTDFVTVTGNTLYGVQVYMFSSGETMIYETSSADGYPTWSGSNQTVAPSPFSDMTEVGPSP